MKKYQRAFDPLGDPKDGHILTRAIIDTIYEPLIVLDEDLRVIAASRSFYDKFKLTHRKIHNKLFYDIDGGSWNSPTLRHLLGQIIPRHKTIDGYRIKQHFPLLGERTMLVNAREIRYENGRKKMLLSIFDITKQEILKEERENLIIQKDLLLKEMRHRIANSLQLIASILILKAGMVKSEETRLHLEDAHGRIMTVATVQEQLDPSALEGGMVKVDKYLDSLCKSLAKSMIGGRKPISLVVESSKSSVTPEKAISLGLITTELVINCLKHAFPNNKAGKVLVSYYSKGHKWTLDIEDNGVGQSGNIGDTQNPGTGLGTGIVSALAKQMEAEVRTKTGKYGTKISISSI